MMEFGPHDCVTVKCKRCRLKHDFFPVLVRSLGPCECGNDDWGSPTRDWPRGEFGDFWFVRKEVVIFRLPGWPEVLMT